MHPPQCLDMATITNLKGWSQIVAAGEGWPKGEAVLRLHVTSSPARGIGATANQTELQLRGLSAGKSLVIEGNFYFVSAPPA